MKKFTITLAGLLLIATVLFAALGAYLKYDVLAPFDLYQDKSIIEVPFLLLGDESAQYTLLYAAQKEQEPPETEPLGTEPPEAVTDPVEETQIPETEPPETEPVVLDIEERWFDDALFIGDSRTTGLRDIARLGEAHYFCDLNMTVFKVMNYSVYDKGFGRKHLDEVLEKYTYGKIFIHLGLNECANDHDMIIEKYQELIDLIREKQPDAVIVLQSIMTVSDAKASDPKFSMENIQGLNERIQELAEANGLLYQDTNEWAADEDGYLREEIRMDGAHPTGVGYREWAQWILEQARYMGIPMTEPVETTEPTV